MSQLTDAPMSRLQVAQQLHLCLLREIEHEIEIERLLSDARYARDVLLVCDACPGTGLGDLASSFRALTPKPVLAAPAPAEESTPPLAVANSQPPAHLNHADEWEPDISAVALTPLATHRALYERELGIAPPSASAHGSIDPGADWTELAERSAPSPAAAPVRRFWLARWLRG